jgi:Tfp pilus assembly protein PilE
MKFNEQGRSMIEMLGVLAIVGVLSVGGIAGYSKAMAKFNTNKAIDQVNMIATNVRTMFASQRGYEGLSVDIAIKANLIPSELYDAKSTGAYSGGAISNPFGGTTFVSAAKNSTDNDSFVIAMDKIPQAACVAMATTEWGSEAGGGLLALKIEATGTNAASSTGAANATAALTAASGTYIAGDATYGFPVSVAAATGACAATNTFTWKYL